MTGILNEMARMWKSQNLTVDKSTLLADGTKPSSGPMLTQMVLPYVVTRLQWINTMVSIMKLITISWNIPNECVVC